MVHEVVGAPLDTVPSWAMLQRRLFDENESAWREFSELYCEPDGRLRYGGRLEGTRDGVDDFYEPFFNWPAFYSLGGSAEILQASKHHWRGVTAQLTDYDMLLDEFDKGYDWYHQGESLIFFYALCAADPADAEFADRAKRFSELYTSTSSGAYDHATNLIAAPHNGSAGLREGLGHWQTYPASQSNMKPYGLPLEYLPGIRTWDDLADPLKADLMGAHMQSVLGRGDVAANLLVTSLVVNRWLFDGDESSAAWVERYVEGWRRRADAHGGLVPDNVDPHGAVGGLHDGRWYGGHYGWTWPHGLPSVGMAALVGAMNHAFVTGDKSVLDLARVPLDTVIERSITATVQDTPMSLRGTLNSVREGWLYRLGPDAAREGQLVPHRFGRDGWFDFGPMPMSLPTWLWWFSREVADWERLEGLISRFVESPTEVKMFRDKEEAGHEIPWVSFLAGRNPGYPEAALEMALGQVDERRELMRRPMPDPATMHIHYWQQVNPVVTEVLTQLTSGAPQVLYNGGIPHVAVSYVDPEANRPGLPPDVAALVRGIDGDTLRIELVNLSRSETRKLWVLPGRFGDRDIASVAEEHPDRSAAPRTVEAPYVQVELPPLHHARLVLTTRLSGRRPQHRLTPVPPRVPNDLSEGV
jgi:hypothetical protein